MHVQWHTSNEQVRPEMSLIVTLLKLKKIIFQQSSYCNFDKLEKHFFGKFIKKEKLN